MTPTHATGSCSICGRRLPEAYLAEVDGRTVCSGCAARGLADADAAEGAPARGVEPELAGAGADARDTGAAPTDAPRPSPFRRTIASPAPARADRDGALDRLRGSRLAREVDEWVAGRSWLVRLPLLLYFGWVLLRHLRDPLYAGLFDGLNLALHEVGHILFAPLGPFMGVAGGTIFQLLCPLIAAALFYRQRDFFAIAISICWLATNFFDVSVYAGDARMNALPLVSPFGGAPAHDWTTMLIELDMLDRDRELAWLFRRLGVASMLLGLASGGWLLWRMARSKGTTAA